MNVKLLLTTMFLGYAISASAIYRLEFRDTNGSATLSPFDYPVVEGTKTDTYYGDPLFNEDGSIDLVTNELAANGIWFRTVRLTEECPKEYTVLAFEYKSNRKITEVVVFPQEGNNNYAEFMNGDCYRITEEFQTIYIPLTRENSGWGTWGEDPANNKNYFWISSNDANAKTAGWKVSIKNIRLMTMAEATAECGSSTETTVEDMFSLPNTDFSKDFDTEMGEDGADVYVAGGVNPLLQTAKLVRPLPQDCYTFKFDYKLQGTSYAPNVYMHKQANYSDMTFVGVGPTLEGVDDAYASEWKTFSMDLSEKIKEIGFAQKFGDAHFLWLQFKDMPEENILWIKNVRWENPSPSGINAIDDDIQRPADNRIFNLMGVEVKGDDLPAGLYIRNGEKFIVK